MDNNLENLKEEKIEFLDKNKLSVKKTSKEIIFQKKNLSENFKMLLTSLKLDHVYDHFSKTNKNNLI